MDPALEFGSASAVTTRPFSFVSTFVGVKGENKGGKQDAPHEPECSHLLMVQMPKHMDMQICSHAKHFSELII